MHQQVVAAGTAIHAQLGEVQARDRREVRAHRLQAPRPHLGNVRAFAVTAKNRLASEPNIPTVDEAGMPGFYIAVWHALWFPKGTPKDVVMKMNGAVREVLADPTVQKRLVELGQDIPPVDQQTPEALHAYHKAEIEKWHPIIKAANIKPE